MQGMGMPGMGGRMGAMGGMPPGGMGGMGGGMMGPPAGQKHGELSAPGGKRPVELPENVRTFLDKRLDIDFSDAPFAEVLEYLRQAGNSDVAFIIETPDDWQEAKVKLSLKQVTVQSGLQALADLHHCAFVFRDYGILVLGPNAEESDTFDSFRAARTPMIAPPSPVMGGQGGGGGGFF